MKTNLFEMPTLSESVAILNEASKQMRIRFENMIERHSIANRARIETINEIMSGNLKAGNVEIF